MKKIFFVVILFTSAAALSSCVTMGKYEELEAKKITPLIRCKLLRTN